MIVISSELVAGVSVPSINGLWKYATDWSVKPITLNDRLTIVLWVTGLNNSKQTKYSAADTSLQL